MVARRQESVPCRRAALHLPQKGETHSSQRWAAAYYLTHGNRAGLAGSKGIRIEAMHFARQAGFETSVLKRLRDGKNNHHVALALRTAKARSCGRVLGPKYHETSATACFLVSITQEGRGVGVCLAGRESALFRDRDKSMRQSPSRAPSDSAL
jgi:hypothetical protein